ncbi:MAG TPA: hypothetical protein VGI39_13290, partial [Polyangiaceae bacterium]
MREVNEKERTMRLFRKKIGRTKTRLARAAALLVAFAAPSASAFDDVQAPQLRTPDRGSIAGSLSGLALGPADVTRGGFSLPSPMKVPEDRGPLRAPIFPSYDPDKGISSWGMGWGMNLEM